MNWTRLTYCSAVFFIILILPDWLVSQPRPSRPRRLDLMPLPAQVTPGEGRLVIDGGFAVALSGYQEPRLQAAAERLLQRLKQRTGIVFPRGIVSDAAQAALALQCQSAGEVVQTMRADESYTLELSARGGRLSAPNPLGILRGVETILQLVDIDRDSFFLPALTIRDQPRFTWRGLLIDACRHWQPIEVIRRNLDAMAAVKMNVLHWHLSEDQGFRVESKRFPKLQQMGSDGLYFTQDQIREVVAYARDRGIRVVPEFDMPGHTTAWFVGYPELASAPGPYQIERQWGVFDPAIDPTREEVYNFLDEFIGEMAALFPDEYFHIGGDEVNGKQWDANPAIQRFKEQNNLKSNHDLQAYFNKRLLQILTRHGKKMIGWDEIFHPELPKDIVVQSWRGQKSLAQGARQGYTGILSFGYYLDHILTARFHYENDPWEKEAAVLSPEEKSRIIGGEACMWSEYVTPENIDSRIWPRNAAIAERLWSPAAARDVDDMYRRLQRVSLFLESVGATHRSSYPAMLQRLAGGAGIGPVRVLADVVEPVKYYDRGRAQAYTSFTAMNRLVDTARPESDAARRLAQAIDRIIADPTDRRSVSRPLRLQFQEWRDNDARLRQVIEYSYLLTEATGLSETLSKLGSLGLQALDYLESGNSPPVSWKDEQAAFLAAAEKPQAEVLIMVVPSIRKLVEAAAR